MSADVVPDQAPEYIPEKVKKAEKKLEENPYDLDAWSILIREAQNQPIDKARKTYERLITQFPSSGRFWKLYIEAEEAWLSFWAHLAKRALESSEIPEVFKALYRMKQGLREVPVMSASNFLAPVLV